MNFPPVLKKQPFDYVLALSLPKFSDISSWVEAKLSPGKQQMDLNTSMDMFIHLLRRLFYLPLISFSFLASTEYNINARHEHCILTFFYLADAMVQTMTAKHP